MGNKELIIEPNEPGMPKAFTPTKMKANIATSKIINSISKNVSLSFVIPRLSKLKNIICLCFDYQIKVDSFCFPIFQIDF